MIIGWVVINDDFSVISSKDSAPEDVQIDGIQWIVEFTDNGGKRNVHGMDYYRWTGDSWAGGSDADLKNWLRLREKPAIILYGRWISDEDYDKVRKIVQGLEYDD